MTNKADYEFHNLISSEEDALILLADAELLFDARKPGRCTTCNSRHTYTAKYINHRKIIKLSCTNYACSSFPFEATSCPFFDFIDQLEKNACCMTTLQMLEIIFYWTHQMDIKTVESLTGLSHSRIRAWFSHILTVPLQLFEERSKLGGNNSVVHVEEILISTIKREKSLSTCGKLIKRNVFARRKTHFGTSKMGPWLMVFFGQCSGKNDVRCLFATDRREKELVSLFTNEIRPDSVVITSKFPGYNAIGKIFTQHKPRNLSRGYSSPKGSLTKDFIETKLVDIIDFWNKAVMETSQLDVDYFSSILVGFWWRVRHEKSSSSYMEAFLNDLKVIVKSNKLSNLPRLRAKLLDKNNSNKEEVPPETCEVQNIALSKSVSGQDHFEAATMSGYFSPDQDHFSVAQLKVSKISGKKELSENPANIEHEQKVFNELPKMVKNLEETRKDFVFQPRKKDVKQKSTNRDFKTEQVKKVAKNVSEDLSRQKPVERIEEKNLGKSTIFSGFTTRVIECLRKSKDKAELTATKEAFNTSKTKAKLANRNKSHERSSDKFRKPQQTEERQQKILTEQFRISHGKCKNVKFKTSISQFFEVPHMHPDDTWTMLVSKCECKKESESLKTVDQTEPDFQQKLQQKSNPRLKGVSESQRKKCRKRCCIQSDRPSSRSQEKSYSCCKRKKFISRNEALRVLLILKALGKKPNP